MPGLAVLLGLVRCDEVRRRAVVVVALLLVASVLVGFTNSSVAGAMPDTFDFNPVVNSSRWIPATIASDCSVDVTDEIDNWIASAPDGTSAAPTILNFGLHRCYRVDGTLGAPFGTMAPAGYRRNYLIFDGNGSTIDGSFSLPPPHTNRAGFSFMYGVGLTVRDFVIKGNHPNPCNLDASGNCRDGGYNANYEWHHGVAFFASTDVALRNTTILNVYGDGVTLAQGSSPGEHTSDAVIDGNSIDGTGRMGMSLTAVTNAQITNNTLDRISYHDFDLENEGGNPVRDVTISGNTSKRKYLSFLNASSGECTQNNQGNITFSDNSELVAGVTSFPSIRVEAYTSRCSFSPRVWSGYTITGNTLRTSQGVGPNGTVQLFSVQNSVVDNNQVEQVADSPAIQIGDLRRPAMQPAEVRGNDLGGVIDAYSFNGRIDDPTVTGCGNTTSAGTNQPRAC